MKDQMLKIAKVKSEKEFYKKYPTEEAFMKAHGKAFKKAAMGKSMVYKQLNQLTDWDNPQMAQMGTSAPLAFNDLLAGAKATNAGITKEEQLKQESLQQIANQQPAQSSDGGLGDIVGMFTKGDTSSGMSSDVMDAISAGFEMRRGGHIPKAQMGGGLTGIGNLIGSAFGKQGGLGSGLADIFGGEGTAKGIMQGGQDIFKGGFKSGMQQLGTSQGLKAAGSAVGLSALNAAPQILQGIDQMKQQQQNIEKADQAAQISGLTADAANVRPEKKQRKYVRPEDSLVQPGQLGSPTGMGTSYLQDGGEIQNTYAPNDIYTDLGFEPLGETMKQYKHGGHVYSAEFGDYFQDSGQASIGSGIGSAVGSIFGPAGSAVGSVLGRVAGNLLGGADDANKLARLKEQTQKNTERAAWSAGAKNLQAQNASFMEYGGSADKEHAWVSNGWQPQVIAKFGEYNVKDLLKPPHDADMLRAGGHLKEYTPPSAEAMFTGRPPLEPLTMDNGGRMTSTNMMFDTDKYPRANYGVQMAMGGDLKVGDGGHLETISYNPNLPGGEIGMFRGASHDNGGIQTQYGDNHVEVEGGEPAVKLQDGGSSDNLVVFGNMKINSKIADLMGDPKAKGMKFKKYVADIAKNDAKQNKRVQKALELIENSDENSTFDQLSLNTGQAMLNGAKSWQKINADKIKEAGVVQDAIHQTAKQLGVKSDKLAEGKLEKETDPSMVAQKGINLGKEIVRQALGKNYNPAADSPFSLVDYSNLPSISSQGAPAFGPIGGPSVPEAVQLTDARTPNYAFSDFPDTLKLKEKSSKSKGSRKGSEWKDALTTVLSYAPAFLRPSNANQPLSPDQLYPEYYALANNQLEPVQAQTYKPMLSTPYDISLQDQINAIDSQSRAAIRAAGSNPSAQAMIMSQAADAKNKVLGEQARINQANRMATYDKNRELLNQAQMQNLQILDNQYVRQAQAKSNTKEQAIAALSSIAAKTAQQRALNRKLSIMENLYGFRFSPSGVAYNVNEPYQFNMSGMPTYGSRELAPGYEDVYNAAQQRIGTRRIPKGGLSNSSPSDISNFLDDNYEKNGGKTSKTKARNSSIVKALKNL